MSDWPEYISSSISYADATHSDKAKTLGVTNDAPIQLRPNALRIAELCEQVFALIGKCHLNSMYRSLTVNVLVGGSGSKPGEKVSAHCDFRAADLRPLEMPIQDAFEKLFQAQKTKQLNYQKMILETDGNAHWVHIQVEPKGVIYTPQTMLANRVNGKMVYTPYGGM